MSSQNNKAYLIASVIGHLLIVLAFVLGFDLVKPNIVFENTNKNDVISAVVLGDSIKSKILPQKIAPEPKPVLEKMKEVAKEEPKPIPPPPEQKVVVKKEVVALKKPPVKKPAFHPDDLLADIKKQTQKPKQLTKKEKQLKQKQLQAQFAKTLQQQAEKTMRQNLLNEDIKLSGSQLRQSQGIVNKYQALVKQAISEHWVIPPQLNKKLSCTLLIRTAPGGMVLDVQVTKSSGEPSLDSSARAAVMKSSPLPVPKEAGDFEPFRRFVLVMKPETFI